MGPLSLFRRGRPSVQHRPYLQLTPGFPFFLPSPRSPRRLSPLLICTFLFSSLFKPTVTTTRRRQSLRLLGRLWRAGPRQDNADASPPPQQRQRILVRPSGTFPRLHHRLPLPRTPSCRGQTGEAPPCISIARPPALRPTLRACAFPFLQQCEWLFFDSNVCVSFCSWSLLTGAFVCVLWWWRWVVVVVFPTLLSKPSWIRLCAWQLEESLISEH